MNNKILYIFMLVGLLSSAILSAQNNSSDNYSASRIKGTRFIPYPNYGGSPFLTDDFMIGEIDLTDGTRASNLGLHYSIYRDELIYYNTNIQAQIVIDKISLKGFSFIDENGIKRTFRRQFYNGESSDDYFFEILSDGKTSLIVRRKAELEECDPSYNKSGMAYKHLSNYFIYNEKKGYSTIKPNKNSLLLKFGKPDQKLIKKLLRKNNFQVNNESGLTRAWNLIITNGISPDL